MNDFLYAIWFFLPAGFANIVPVFAAHLPLLKHWNAPIDNRLTFRGQRLFGSSKTWRGFICGVVIAAITFWLQQKLTPHLGNFSAYLETVNYNHLSLWLGPLLGFGVLAGDSIESFFKRQLGIAPSKSWFPFDQLDYIIGGLICSLPVIRLPLKIYIWIVLVWFITHLIVSYFGYLLHLKKTPI